jgi:hypothetical protein
MTNDEAKNQGEALAQHIADAMKDRPGVAEVRINPIVQAPIPANIAANILEFLRRVESKGMEAVAWCEAYQYVQQFVQPQPGVPFGGLPTKK